MGIDFHLDEERFIGLLTRLIGESQHLQNHPPKHVPEEDRAAKHVLEVLEPHREENGGPLKVEQISYSEGRGNLLITYPGSGDGIVSFVGSHLDVVPADPEGWEKDPFSLTIEGEKLYGRGTTDCLGHVALLTDLFAQLAEKKPALKTTVVAVFIANEENSSVSGIGVDELVRQGKMDHLKDGPLYWVDSADKHPTIGTGSMAPWEITATGKLFHSGMPHMAINAMELAMEAVKRVQERFYEEWPAHQEEARYLFATPSTMKPTMWSYPGGSINQIPGEATISGDIRMTPFYDIAAVQRAVEGYVAEINSDLSALPTRGPVSAFELESEGRTGRVDLNWLGEAFEGIACDLDSEGYRVLRDATADVIGEVKPISMTGSLPLVKDLQNSGFDVQITGFGREDTYHAPNEFAVLGDFRDAVRILCGVINRLEA